MFRVIKHSYRPTDKIKIHPLSILWNYPYRSEEIKEFLTDYPPLQECSQVVRQDPNASVYSSSLTSPDVP